MLSLGCSRDVSSPQAKHHQLFFSNQHPQTMSLKIGDTFPNFEVETTHGTFKLHDYFGERCVCCLRLPCARAATPSVLLRSWGILFSHPHDYTPVCTTELAEVIKILPEFAKRNVKPIALSCDEVSSHKGWAPDFQVRLLPNVALPDFV